MTTKTTRIACGLAVAAVLLAGCTATTAPEKIDSVPVVQASAASLADDEVSTVADAADSSCSSSYTHGWTSVDMVITNNTPFTLNFESDLSGPSTGHWHQRPLQVLQPGQCEVVNAYASTDVDIFNLNVVYSTTWGDYFPFEGTANGTNPTFNPNVFEGVPQYHKNNQYWSGAIDSRYTISSSGQDGHLHTHYNLTLS
jgi:hypothetical protein